MFAGWEIARRGSLRHEQGWLDALVLLQLKRTAWAQGRLHRFGLIAGLVVLGGILMRVGHGVIAPVQVEDARLAVPSTPLVPGTELVLAKEYGRLGHVYVREGAAVAPGQVLFSLKRDPELDQDLVDRGLARDISEVNAQIRETRRALDSLAERSVLARSVVNPQFEQRTLHSSCCMEHDPLAIRALQIQAVITQAFDLQAEISRHPLHLCHPQIVV